MATSERLLIIDGLNMFIRNWVVVPQMNSNGDPIGGVTGFLRSLKSIMRDVKPTKIIVVWDGEGGASRRRGIYSEYKAGRKPRLNRQHGELESVEASQENMRLQHSKIRQYLDLLGVVQIEISDIEADDVIGFLASQLCSDTDKVVVSSDKDFLQLVDAHTLIYSPTKKIYYTAKVLHEQYGIMAENFIYMKALMGDKSDNIRGIKGVGEKTVMKLFPFLGDTISTLEDIFLYAEKNIKKSPRYKDILDSRALLIENVMLMQLSSPVISGQAVRVIKHALEPSEVKFTLSEFKLSLLRDGIQFTDFDFIPVFNEYKIRSKRGNVNNVE